MLNEHMMFRVFFTVAFRQWSSELSSSSLAFAAVAVVAAAAIVMCGARRMEMVKSREKIKCNMTYCNIDLAWVVPTIATSTKHSCSHTRKYTRWQTQIRNGNKWHNVIFLPFFAINKFSSTNKLCCAKVTCQTISLNQLPCVTWMDVSVCLCACICIIRLHNGRCWLLLKVLVNYHANEWIPSPDTLLPVTDKC